MELIIYMDSWGRELDGPASGSYNKVYRTNDDHLPTVKAFFLFMKRQTRKQKKHRNKSGNMAVCLK